MHETSKTVRLPDGTYANVYGRKQRKAGQPLPLQFPFEKSAYPTAAEALRAAKERSRLIDMREHNIKRRPRRPSLVSGANL